MPLVQNIEQYHDVEGLALVSGFKNTNISAGTTYLIEHVIDSDTVPRRNVQ